MIGDGPRNFEPRLGDENDTLTSTPFSKIPHHDEPRQIYRASTPINTSSVATWLCSTIMRGYMWQSEPPVSCGHFHCEILYHPPYNPGRIILKRFQRFLSAEEVPDKTIIHVQRLSNDCNLIAIIQSAV
ncbi:hypothetical protein TNCV_2037561 [Trichonephila clavipes]|nr:hypothetical protein TNCV_2037561 [Trichonephila clavipes]